jgi:hypothetical protein
MSFIVEILQQPEGGETHKVRTELSSEELQKRLHMDMRSVVSISGKAVTVPQKMELRKIAANRIVQSITHEGDALLVAARFGGRPRTWGIKPDGAGYWAKGGNDPLVRSRTLPSRELGRA